jgi:phosphoheptose isomerase
VDYATSDLMQRVDDHLLQSAAVKRLVSHQCGAEIIAAAEIIAESLRSGGKLLLCGNGGSAADCQHVAAELVSTLTQSFPRRALAALALTTDSSILTAYTNDYGFDGVFARQVEALGQPGDVLIGISTSGNSANILAAMETARALDMRTIGLSGAGGRIADIANVVVAVPSRSTQHIQECHITIGHIVCDLVECLLFDKSIGGQEDDYLQNAV